MRSVVQRQVDGMRGRPLKRKR